MMRAEVRDSLKKDVHRRTSSKTLGRGERIILHVDMDAFFAAIEERDNPGLRGKPVIVGGPKGSRGVVTTANYIARRYGVHAGISLTEAGWRCPDAEYVRTKGGKYTAVSLQLMQILRQFSPIVEPYSIDEAFLDATGCLGGNRDKGDYGTSIKAAIQRELNLTASVGIAPSRIIAKVASGMSKPDGLTVIERGQVARLLGPLPAKKIPGVGPATERILQEINVQTVHDLITCPESLLIHALGAHGRDLRSVLAGKSGSSEIIAIEERPEDKSMGHEHTFHHDISESAVLRQQLLYLSDRVGRRMRKAGYLGRVVTLKLRLHDFTTFDHQRKLHQWTDDPADIHAMAWSLLNDLWHENSPPVRLVGVSLSGLIRPGDPLGVQSDLFRAERIATRGKLLGAMDRLRDTYGEDVVRLAGGQSQRHSTQQANKSDPRTTG